MPSWQQRRILAIDLLITQIEELERKANAYKASVNVLCENDGLPPKYPDSGGPRGDGGGIPRDSKADPASHHHHGIRPDTFYGKPQQTAVRELLAIRKTLGDGPARPAEILGGLKAGGYQVEAKTDDIALVGIRAMLRKRISVFHKSPNGDWGLREWYPNAKAHKELPDKGGAQSPPAATDGEENEINNKAATPPNGAAAA